MSPIRISLGRRLVAEALGTGLLLAAVVGSGIMADDLAGGNVAIALRRTPWRQRLAAYWFTASTSFANPAGTIARSLTDTFAGIRPIDVPTFVIAQVVGALAATFLFRWLAPPRFGASGDHNTSR